MAIVRVMFWWLVLLFGSSMTIIGLLLPLVPGLPWLFFVNLALEKMYPVWWHRQWLYRLWIRIKLWLKHKAVTVNN